MRYNCHITFCKFNVYNLMTRYTFITSHALIIEFIFCFFSAVFLCSVIHSSNFDFHLYDYNSNITIADISTSSEV